MDGWVEGLFLVVRTVRRWCLLGPPTEAWFYRSKTGTYRGPSFVESKLVPYLYDRYLTVLLFAFILPCCFYIFRCCRLQ